MAKYNKKHQQVPDKTPVEVPLGCGHAESLDEKIQRLTRTHVSQHFASQGAETFEEANDFDIDEDPDPISQYELMEEEYPIQDADPVEEPRPKEVKEPEENIVPTEAINNAPQEKQASPTTE